MAWSIFICGESIFEKSRLRAKLPPQKKSRLFAIIESRTRIAGLVGGRSPDWASRPRPDADILVAYSSPLSSVGGCHSTDFKLRILSRRKLLTWCFLLFFYTRFAYSDKECVWVWACVWKRETEYVCGFPFVIFFFCFFRRKNDHAKQSKFIDLIFREKMNI